MILKLIKPWINPDSGLVKKPGLIFEVDNPTGKRLISEGVAITGEPHELINYTHQQLTTNEGGVKLPPAVIDPPRTIEEEE